MKAQFTQVELFSGFDKTDFTLYSSYAINEGETLSLNTLAFFQKFEAEKDQVFDEIGLQPTLFWNVTDHIAIGPSLYYNSIAGYSERLSALFKLKKSQFLLALIPTIAYSEQTNATYAEAFAQFQFSKPLNDKISLWVNGQFLSVWDKFTTHSRSFQQWRAGVSYNGHQLGIGFDFDQYGPQPIQKSSFGIYYRKTL